MTRASKIAIWGLFAISLVVFIAVMIETWPDCNCGIDSARKTEVRDGSATN